MSLILDALHKADRERQNQKSTPGIDASHAPVAASNPQQKIWMITVLLVLLVILLMVVIVKQKSNDISPVVNEKIQKNQSPPGATLEAIVKENSPSNFTELKEMPTTGEEVSNLQPEPSAPAPAIQNAEARRIAAQYEVVNENATEGNAVKDNVIKESVEEQEVTSLYAEVEKKSADVALLNVINKDALAAYPNIGVIHELPLSMQNRIPTLMYSMHEYNPAGRSYIMINKRQLRVGQKFAGDCVLEKILSDGILVTIEDKSFKLKALSSWVNM